MPKRRRPQSRQQTGKRPAATGSPRQAGLRAFRQGAYATAIEHWSGLPGPADPALSQALAEAHFRQGLTRRLQSSAALPDLVQATQLAPAEGRYWYHLALARHRAGDLTEAASAYARAAELGYQGAGLATARGLAEVERHPGVDLAALAWLPADARRFLQPIAALMRGDPAATLAAAAGPAPLRLWRGLAHLASGESIQALALLDQPEGEPLPGAAEAVRLLYRGLAAAASQQPDLARQAWRQAAAVAGRQGEPAGPPALQARSGARRSGPRGAPPRPPRPAEALGWWARQARRREEAQRTLQWPELWALLQRGAYDQVLAATDEALAATFVDPAIMAYRVVALHRMAQAAVAAGDWAQAVRSWSVASIPLEEFPELGPPLPFRRNTAIAFERVEEWGPAAQAWKEYLQGLPRRVTNDVSRPPVAEERQWIERRILANLERAGLAGQAAVQARKVLKSAPDDLATRLQLATALLAEGRLVAARHELARILERDPNHLPALLLQAQVHHEQDEIPVAVQLLERVLALDPANAAAHRGLAQARIDEGILWFGRRRYAQARTAYQQALEHAPDDVTARCLLADTELFLGAADEARRQFALAMDTGDPEAYVRAFESWARTGAINEARQVVARLEERGVASSGIYQQIAAAALEFGESPAAAWQAWGRQLLDRAVELAPDRAQALEELVADLGADDPELCAPYAEELARLRPDDPGSLMALALVQVMGGDPVGGLATLELASHAARQAGDRQAARQIAKVRRELAQLVSTAGPHAHPPELPPPAPPRPPGPRPRQPHPPTPADATQTAFDLFDPLDPPEP